MDEQRKNASAAEADGVIEGRNAVIEALRAGEAIDKIYLQKGDTDKTLGHIASKARAAGVVVVEADKRKLDAMSRTHAHQGVIALAAVREYVSVESILQSAADRGEAPLIVVCDEISDPHNLGAIIRTAECAGVHGIVIGKHRGVTVNDTVLRCSAGAAEHVKIAKVTNVNDAINYLKSQNVYVYCADMDGEPMYRANLTGAIALLVGGEDSGVKRLSKELADGVISIPMSGKINSLNASVAAAVVIYEKVRQDRK